MNYMKDVAALLGVQLNEEFKIILTDGEVTSSVYKITEKGLIGQYAEILQSTLANLLTGRYQIQKLPFKPKFEDRYWTLDYTPENEIKAVEYVWKYWARNYLDYYNGLCFRTKQEALANKDKLRKIINHYSKEN